MLSLIFWGTFCTGFSVLMIGCFFVFGGDMMYVIMNVAIVAIAANKNIPSLDLYPNPFVFMVFFI